MSCGIGFCGTQAVGKRRWRPNGDPDEPIVDVDVCKDHWDMFDAMKEAGELVE